MIILDEKTNQRYELLNYYGHIDNLKGEVKLGDDIIGIIEHIFPDIKSVNHNCGYVVFQDDTIKCSLEANAYVSAYDGCKVGELVQMYNN